MMYKKSLLVITLVAAFIAMDCEARHAKASANASAKAKAGKKDKKCFKEKDATQLARQLLDNLQNAFNNNQLDNFNDISPTATVMTRDSATLFGQEAITVTRERRQNARDTIADRLESTVEEARFLSCDRMYHVETSRVFNGDELVLKGRWFILWKKFDNGEWLADVVMNNLPDDPFEI